MTLENIVAKEEISHINLFSLLPQCFQMFSIITLTLTDVFYGLMICFSNLSAADLLYVGKGSCFLELSAIEDNMMVLYK